MNTEDLIKVKNQLMLAIVETFNKAGIDPYAGMLILDSIHYELAKPLLDSLIGRDLVLKEQNEELSSE